MKAYVGVSGFSYDTWKGKFYPKELKSEEFLNYYSQHLNTVEINSSFYYPPKEATVKGWGERTGEDFLFSFKAPKQITHVLRLGEGSPESAARFSKTVDVLGGRRGPVLLQLPPFLKQDLGLLENFLARTETIGQKVFEFRHPSWFEETTYGLLERHNAGFCIAETEDLKPEFKVTSDFSYFRLRLDSYDSKGIDKWGSKITTIARDSKTCFVYLRHDETGENATLAHRLEEKLAS